MKPKVLITHRIFPEVLDHLRQYAECETATMDIRLAKGKLIQKIQDKQGLLPLLVDTIDREVMEAAPELKIIANCAVGYNNIDLDHAKKRGIMVTNTPGVLTETTADLTWALILAVARRIPQADRFTREKKFRGWELDLFLGQEVSGKRLGIIGMGRIGRAVALRAQSFCMNVYYNDSHRLTPEEEQTYKAQYQSLDELLISSDIVTLHVSLTPETLHLISAERLALMKADAILVNVSRGPVVDEKALARALAERRIWGAGLDVYEREPDIEESLYSLDNVILLPHIGSASRETRMRMAMTAARNLIQGLRGERPENLVF